MARVLVWFRKDLRIHDNECLHRAIEFAKDVIPFYCIDESDFQTSTFGFPKTNSYRAQFLLESLSDLRQSLKERGADLIVRQGKTAAIIKELVEDFKIDWIYTTKEIHEEEIQVQKGVEAIEGVNLKYFHQSTLFHLNDLPFHYKELPKVFTDFRKLVEKKSKPREEFPEPDQIPYLLDSGYSSQIPSLSDLNLENKEIDERAAIKAKGGESVALKRLEDYIYSSNSLIHYKESRNGLIGTNYSSKLSLWLWNGCISPRRIYWEVKRFEKKVKKNQSTYWLVFELIWRDFFKFTSLKHGNKIFFLGGIKGEKQVSIEDNDESFLNWANGTTGVPFIDANMRELNSTGFMSNRGRQNVASFLVNDLKLDWRRGAEYFESMLIDYDVASNYGNWMYVAGVGNDPRDRYFNVISQAKRYDPKGEYVKLWIPELREFESNFVHHPWTANDLFNTDSSYPKPVVEPEYWKKYY